MLINTILTNSAAWYGVTSHDIEQLSQIDVMLLQKGLSIPRSTPIVFMYLELCIIPLKYIIISRRLMFLHYILQENPNTMIHNFFITQYHNPKRGDWSEMVIEDMKSMKLNISFDEIKCLSKLKFKMIVDTAITNAAFQYLIGQKDKLSKISHIQYDKWTMQPYLTPQSNMTNSESQLIITARGRMLNVRCNYKGSHTNLSVHCNVKQMRNKSWMTSGT